MCVCHPVLYVILCFLILAVLRGVETSLWPVLWIACPQRRRKSCGTGLRNIPLCVFFLCFLTHTSYSEERSIQTMGARAYEMWELKEPRRCEWRRWRSLHKAAKFCRDPGLGARFFFLRPDWGLWLSASASQSDNLKGRKHWWILCWCICPAARCGA